MVASVSHVNVRALSTFDFTDLLLDQSSYSLRNWRGFYAKKAGTFDSKPRDKVPNPLFTSHRFRTYVYCDHSESVNPPCRTHSYIRVLSHDVM